MRYHQTIAALGCALFSVSIAHSAILTVDNKPGAVAMYTNMVAAYNVAQDGDTILLAASPVSYGDLGIYKRIHIKGDGYRVGENGFPGLGGTTSMVNTVVILRDNSIGNGSGTTFSGVYIQRFDEYPNTSGAFDRCEIYEWRFNGNASTQWSFNRCYVAVTLTLYNNCNLRNSIFRGGVGFVGSGNTVSSCVIVGPLNAEQPSNSVSNSIVVSASLTSTSFSASYKGSITHSMAVGDSVLAEGRRSFLPGGGGNLNGYNLTDVFIPSSTLDGKWQLNAGSPAIAAGFGGVDIGAFGGVSPYVLSGIPPRPRITRLVVPAAATDATGLQFEVDAKAF